MRASGAEGVGALLAAPSRGARKRDPRLCEIVVRGTARTELYDGSGQTPPLHEKWERGGCSMRKVTRRRFLAEGSLVCAGGAAFALGVCSQCGTPKPGGELKLKPPKQNSLTRDTVVARGSNPSEITEAAIAALGGLEKLVTSGDIVIVKPNIAWDRTPEQAANTNPEVVAAIVKLALKAGAGEVHVFDHAINDARLTYKSSGIAEAARRAGAKVGYVRGKDDPRFRDMSIPNGVIMPHWGLHDMLTRATVLINVPIAKHHNLTRLSLGLKNLMGLAGGDRGTWHPDIAKRLADLSSAVNVDLTVMDAFRILVDHGPTGGSLDDVKETRQVIASVDPVAVDSYAATLFGIKGNEIGYIQEAYERGLGEMELSKVNLKEVTV